MINTLSKEGELMNELKILKQNTINLHRVVTDINEVRNYTTDLICAIDSLITNIRSCNDRLIISYLYELELFFFA